MTRADRDKTRGIWKVNGVSGRTAQERGRTKASRLPGYTGKVFLSGVAWVEESLGEMIYSFKLYRCMAT